jgi:hypothetical protein
MPKTYCWHARPINGDVLSIPEFGEPLDDSHRTGTVECAKVPAGHRSGLSNQAGPEGTNYFIATTDIVPPRVQFGWHIEPAQISCNLTLSEFLDHDASWIHGPYESAFGPVLRCDLVAKSSGAHSYERQKVSWNKCGF